MDCLKCKLELTEDNTTYGLHTDCFLKWFGLPAAAEFVDLNRKATSREPADRTTITSLNGSFFQGKFKKYSAILNGESYILKVKEADYPELPDVEYICNLIAREVGIPVPPFFLIEFFGDRTFVTKNFVRPSGGPMTLNHIFHYFQGKESLDCESILSVLTRETKRYSDVEIFVRVCLFDSLIGNSDRHGRNLGLLHSAKSVQLSPIYDNPSILGLESGNFLKASFGPKGKIFTKGSKEPSELPPIPRTRFVLKQKS